MLSTLFFRNDWIHVALLFAFLIHSTFAAEWNGSSHGLTTITYYTQPLDYLGSCGCAPSSTHYPTAALSSLLFGSTQNFGPGCGACYKLTLLNTFRSTPPFYPTNPESDRSIVVKVTELCPTWSPWCEATPNSPNEAGNFVNFDLAYPNPAGAIPEDFFPHNEDYYGYKDFGVWNATYEQVSCEDWAGYSDPAALGSVNHLGDSVCCSYDPLVNVTCPSFSEEHGDPVPPTGNGSGAERLTLCILPLLSLLVALVV